MSGGSNGHRSFWERYGQKKDTPPDTLVLKDKLKREILELTERHLRGTNRKRILDSGCGTGFFAFRFSELGHDSCGIDVSENSIAIAKRAYPNMRFLVAAADTRMPFDDESFDVVFSCFVIAHVVDTETMFSEFRRVLAPKGKLILATPYHGFWKNLAICLTAFDRHFSVTGQHIRFYTKKSLERIIKANDMEIVHFRLLGRFPLFRKTMYVIGRRK